MSESAMEKGFETPFAGKDLPGNSVMKGVSNPFSTLHQKTKNRHVQQHTKRQNAFVSGNKVITSEDSLAVYE
jgi:hypothetical protein